MKEARLRTPLHIKQGDTYYLQMLWEDSEGVPVDVTGCTARMQLRKDYGSPILLSLTTENGGIVLSLGKIEIKIDAEDTAKLREQRMKFDLEIIYADGRVVTLVGGEYLLLYEVTAWQP